MALEDDKVNIITVGVGWHNIRFPTIAKLVPRDTFTFLTRRLKLSDSVLVPLCATNHINYPTIAERVMQRRDSNLISVSCPFLADLDIMRKGRECRNCNINYYIAYNQVCLDHTFVGSNVSCLVNPRACHKTELIIDEDMIPKSDRLNIGVICSGRVGLSLTTTAARVGHNVSPYNRAEEIKGQFNMERRIPGKEELNKMIR